MNEISEKLRIFTGIFHECALLVEKSLVRIKENLDNSNNLPARFPWEKIFMFGIKISQERTPLYVIIMFINVKKRRLISNKRIRLHSF